MIDSTPMPEETSSEDSGSDISDSSAESSSPTTF